MISEFSFLIKYFCKKYYVIIAKHIKPRAIGIRFGFSGFFNCYRCWLLNIPENDRPKFIFFIMQNTLYSANGFVNLLRYGFGFVNADDEDCIRKYYLWDY